MKPNPGSRELPSDASTPGPVAYLVKMFPRLSETFITNEILELRRRGVDLRLISLMRPTGHIQSEKSLAVAADTYYVPALHGATFWRTVLADHRMLLRHSPGRYIHTLGLVARRFSSSAWKRFFQAGPVARFCLENRVSHVHAAFAHTPASVAWWVSRLTGIRFSFAAHAKDLYLSDPESMRHKLDAARFAWTCTEANGVYLRELGSTTRVQVGYHGCDLVALGPPESTETSKAALPPPPDAETPVILAVGRLVPKKGFDDLLRAAALLRGRGRRFQLLFVGDGPMRAPLEALAESLRLTQHVQFLGSQPPERVRHFYARSRIVALPSVQLANGDRDGIPNVLVEAMAMGVPVVSTRVSAIPELIHHRENGLLVEPHAPEDLGAALEEILDDPRAAGERARRASEDVRERFDLHQNSLRLANLLERHRSPVTCLYVSADLGVPVRGFKGASAHVRQVAQHLAQAGLDVRLLTPSPGPLPPEGNALSIPLLEVPIPAWIARMVDRVRNPQTRQAARELRRLLYNVSLGRAIRRQFHEVHPDFVYERYSLCSIATGWICRRHDKPWLLEVNAPLADEEAAYRNLRWSRLTHALERWCLRHADHVFVVSRTLRAWALELGVAGDRITVLPNGVDRARFHPEVDGTATRRSCGWVADEVVIGFAGSLKPWHGGACLLEAFARARERLGHLRLLLVGDGPESAALAARVRELGLEDKVRFTGAVAQDQVPGWLRAADVLVAPYLPQTRFYFSPLKVLEYLAVGRPVVASNLGDIPEMLDDSCGRLIDPGDSSALARALEELSSDAGLRETMGAAALRRAEGQDWSSRVQVILRMGSRLRNEFLRYPDIQPQRVDCAPAPALRVAP